MQVDMLMCRDDWDLSNASHETWDWDVKKGDRALKWYTAHCSLFTHEILMYAIYKIRRPRLMQGGAHQGLQFTGFRLYNNNYYYYYYDYYNYKYNYNYNY